MKKIFLALFISILFLSCEKNNASDGLPYSEAIYSVEFTGKWKVPEFIIAKLINGKKEN